MLVYLTANHPQVKEKENKERGGKEGSQRRQPNIHGVQEEKSLVSLLGSCEGSLQKKMRGGTKRREK